MEKCAKEVVGIKCRDRRGKRCVVIYNELVNDDRPNAFAKYLESVDDTLLSSYEEWFSSGGSMSECLLSGALMALVEKEMERRGSGSE